MTFPIGIITNDLVKSLILNEISTTYEYFNMLYFQFTENKYHAHTPSYSTLCDWVYLVLTWFIATDLVTYVKCAV